MKIVIIFIALSCLFFFFICPDGWKEVWSSRSWQRFGWTFGKRHCTKKSKCAMVSEKWNIDKGEPPS